ncbi:MAG: glycosyltransferase [Spirulina sp.]
MRFGSFQDHSSTYKSDILISVVSPICDAEDWIESYLSGLSELLSSEFKDYEIVLIDNGSRDDTLTIVRQAQQTLRNIQLYVLARPVPYESAFIVGLEQAIGDVVITMDAAYDPIDCLMPMIQMSQRGFDMVYGLRSDRMQHRHGLYNWLSIAFFKLYQSITQESLPIAASTLRLYSRYAINSFIDNTDRYSLFPVIGAFSGLKYATLDYHRINRTNHAVRQSYIGALERAFCLILLSSHYPLRLLSLLSLTGAFLNILYSLYVVLINFFKGHVAEGWTTLSLQNSLMFFILFIILSVLSEYIARLFMKNQNRPFYLISNESKSLILQRKNDINVTGIAAKDLSRSKSSAS